MISKLWNSVPRENCSNSETRHIDAVNRLAQRYGVTTSSQRAGVYSVSKIQDLYNQLYSKGVRSQRDALEVGCMVEVTGY